MTIEVNSKSVHIPDAEIANSMAKLDLSKDEAIQMWLEDNDYCENEEVEILTQKAKENKVSRGAKSEKALTKTDKKPKERKPDIEKEEIITALSEFLTEKGCTFVEITNKSKIIEFNIGETHFKLDLIRQKGHKKS